MKNVVSRDKFTITVKWLGAGKLNRNATSPIVDAECLDARKVKLGLLVVTFDVICQILPPVSPCVNVNSGYQPHTPLVSQHSIHTKNNMLHFYIAFLIISPQQKLTF